MLRKLLFIFLLGFVLCASQAANAAPRVDIYGPGQNSISLGLAAPLTGPNAEARGNGAKLQQIVNTNLSFLPFMRLTDPNTVPGGTVLGGVEPPAADFSRFQAAGSDIVVTTLWPGGDSGTQNAVMGALKNNFYNVHVFSGHTHAINNNLYAGWYARSGRQIYEHTLQTLSGYFWDADIAYDIGSPAGYGVFTFDHDDLYAEYNKVTKEEPTFQFRTYNGGESYTRSGKTYSWDSSVSGKYVVRLPDAGDPDDSADYWRVYLTKGGSTTELTRVTTAINDRAAHCYIAKMFDNEHGGAGEDTDQFWYSSASFASSGYTITAVHTMKSGWSATYTGKHYVGNNTFKGFAYGERYNE